MAESPRAGSRKTIVVLSITIVIISVLWALGGDNPLKYFVSKTTPLSTPEKKEPKESKLEESQLDWHLSPHPGIPFFRDEEIKYLEDGSRKPYLVIVGHIFDVSKGAHMYKPGTGYHGFIGQDGSRAFVSGQFDEAGLVSDLSGLSSSDFAGLGDWLGFYFKTYTFVGYHYGRFFDDEQKATPAFQEFLKMQKVAKKEKNARASVQKEYPPCNVEWSEKAGTNVWCSTKSGGIERDWVGYPVQFKETPDKDPRCACIQDSQLEDPRIHFYEGCDYKKHHCNGISK